MGNVIVKTENDVYLSADAIVAFSFYKCSTYTQVKATLNDTTLVTLKTFQNKANPKNKKYNSQIEADNYVKNILKRQGKLIIE